MPLTTFVDESIKQVLLADPLVATYAGRRIYQVQAPQGTAYPCVVFSRDTQDKRPYTDMLSAGDLVRATFTVSCISGNSGGLLEARNLARAVKAALQYKRTSAIRLAVVTGDDDQQEPAADGDQFPVYRSDLNVEVTYSEG